MKPRLLISGLTGTVYVVTRYSERPGGQFVAHQKYDVTADFVGMLPEPIGSCDWGHCDGEARSWRFSAQHRQWLPVCDPCFKGNDASVALDAEEAP